MRAALTLLLATAIGAQEPYSPPVEPASQEAADAIAGFVPAKGLQVSLVAAEPELANPVAFYVDARRRFFVTETFRIKNAVLDMRDYQGWLDDELACRTVADRRATFERQFADDFDRFSKEHERIRLLEDRDGDGRAEHATVFADGFHEPMDGIGAGLLVRGADVYYTCIPNLWRLTDADDDGRAESRNVLSTGYGVHVALMGHDMHGLRIGPDRRLYWSIGDRGFHVEQAGRVWANPDSGGVLRCNLDGSGVEVFATGMRNPQELAFDARGDLFTGDNNSDGGDRARFVYVPKGADCGWRIGFQWLPDRGPWSQEKLWHPPFPGQAAHVVPPIAWVGSGPSGLTYYPGTGLPARYADTFFLCDFRGAAAPSGIHALRVRPRGAGFELQALAPFVWRVLATDADFGPDGGLYLTDWVFGWKGEGKGRIYRVHAPEIDASALVQQTARLLRDGMRGRGTGELLALLAHADQRVRQEAQFALTDLGSEVVPALLQLAEDPDQGIARLHALWALIPIGDLGDEPAKRLRALLDDGDAELRTQTARVLGERRDDAARQALQRRLEDPNGRVRAAAAHALAELGDAGSLPALLAALAQNGDQDPWLRHALVMALVGIQQPALLRAESAHPSASVRMGLVLALARHRDPEVVRFLRDPELLVAREAARAVHDAGIDAALPELARLLAVPGLGDPPILRRAIHAAYLGGGRADAELLAALVTRGDAPHDLREFAVTTLGRWAGGTQRDFVLSTHRATPARDVDPAAQAFARHYRRWLTRESEPLRRATATAAAQLRPPAADAALRALLEDRAREPATRKCALLALEQLAPPQLAELARAAIEDPAQEVRAEALRILTRLDPAATLDALARLLEIGTVREQQAALQSLAETQHVRADEILLGCLERAVAGSFPTGATLDLLETAATREAPGLRAALQRLDEQRDAADPLAGFRECLEGGDARRGRTIFEEHTAAICTKCHKLGARGAAEIGPDLAGVGGRATRLQLLESLLVPNAQITPGYGSVTVTTRDGATHTGVQRRDDESGVTLVDAEGHERAIPRASILSSTPAASAMLPMGLVLSKRELRDLVEFLSEQR